MVKTTVKCRQNKCLKWPRSVRLILWRLFADGCHQGRCSKVQTDAGSARSKTQGGKSTLCLISVEKMSFKCSRSRRVSFLTLLELLVEAAATNRCDCLQIEDLNQGFRLKQTEEADHQKRMANTRRIIVDLKAELNKVEDQPDVTQRISDVNVELRRNQAERAKVEGEKSDLRREKDNALAQCKSQPLSRRPSGLASDSPKASRLHTGCSNVPVIVRFGEEAQRHEQLDECEGGEAARTSQGHTRRPAVAPAEQTPLPGERPRAHVACGESQSSAEVVRFDVCLLLLSRRVGSCAH